MMTVDSIGDENFIRLAGRDIPRDLFFAGLFYLLYFASFGSLFPLVGVYFKQLGMTATQAGLLLGSRPFIEFIASPFWGAFAVRFKKSKILLLFSLGAMIVFTLAIGFVQPITPFCVMLDKNESSECKKLVPASEIIRGGALGYLKEAAGIGRRKRNAATAAKDYIIDRIIDLSTVNKDEMIVGKSPLYVTQEKVCNYDPNFYGVLVSPPHSTRVYREPAVEQAFMLLFLLITLGEFFSSPVLALADGYTLGLVSDHSKDFGKIRLFGSMGWGAAMFLIGIGLDYSDTFRNHPCPTKNTSERNYTLCFVTCTLFALASMGIVLKFKFPQPSQQHRPDEVGGLVMDTRIEEVDPTVAQKTRAKQLQANVESEENVWKSTLKAISKDTHFIAYLLGVWCVGFGAGNVFSFLFWHLQDLGGSPILFGMASIINHGTEIVTFFYTFKIINKYGYIKIMYACLGANVLRFLLISWLLNPYMVLPLQILQGCVLALTWASASSYVSIVSPPNLKAYSQYLLLLIYHGLGKGLGPVIGGMIITSIGSRAMFFILALLTLCVLGVNYGVNYKLKNASVKYSNFDAFDDDTGETLAPQGLPMPMHQMENKITEAFNQSTFNNSSNYGAIGQQHHAGYEIDDAYDRYVKTAS